MADKKTTESQPAPAVITGADKPVFYWQAVNYESHEKPKGWSGSIVLITIVLVAVLLYMRQWLGAGVIAAAALALFSQSNSRGNKKNYAIYNQGITIDDKIYTFDQFKSFWLFPYQERYVVRFEPLMRFSLPIEMPINEEDPRQIELFLAKHLPQEETRGEDITDTINRWIKF